MSAPLVSILVPVYNRREFLSACLDSALSQTHRDLEIIVIDNASTDGTWDVCREYAARDRRVRIFRNPENIGPVRNWQRCFKEAQGRYGKMLFSDDLMTPDYLEKTLPLMRDPHVAFVFSQAKIGPRPDQSRIAFQFARHSGRFARNRYLRAALLGHRTPVSPGAALFRISDLRGSLRVTIPSHTIDDFEKHGAGIDQLLYLMTAVRYEEVAYVAEPLVFFRKHAGSITHSGQDSRIADAYHQARVWFAAHTESRMTLACTLAAVWLRSMKRRRRWLHPGRLAAQFLPEAPLS